MSETITIPLKEYIDLKMTECELVTLEGSGVDNWEYYGADYKEEVQLKKKTLQKILGRKPTNEDLGSVGLWDECKENEDE